MAYTSNLLSETAQQSLEQGTIIFDYDRVYLVDTGAADETDGPLTVMSAATQVGPDPLPVIGTTASTPGGIVLYVDRVGPPGRPAGERKKRIWHVPVHYTNRSTNVEEGLPINPVTGEHITDPEDSPQVVDIQYRTEFVQTTEGEVTDVIMRNRQTPAGGVSVPAPPGDRTGTDSFIGWKGPFSNTARDIVHTSARKRRVQKLLRVTRTVRDWSTVWDDIIGKTNQAPLTVTQQDVDGQRYSQTFDAETVLLENIQKQDLWLGTKLYFRASFNLLIDPESIYYDVPDIGMRYSLFEGQFKKPGDQNAKWSWAEINNIFKGRTHFPHVDAYGEPLPDPQPLNGYGHMHNWPRPDVEDASGNSYYVRFKISESADFTPLGIT